MLSAPEALDMVDALGDVAGRHELRLALGAAPVATLCVAFIAAFALVQDAVAFNDGEGAPSDNITHAGNAVLGATFGGGSRIPDGADSDEATDWVRNSDDDTPATGEAHNTPGAPNMVEP